MNAKVMLALVAAALAVAVGGSAEAAAPSPHRQLPAVRQPARPLLLGTLLAAALVQSTPPHTVTGKRPALGLSILARALIAAGIEAGRPRGAQADLARLYLDGAFDPDATLRIVWQPVIHAAAAHLGLAAVTVQRELAAGETLAELAASRHRSAAGLSQAMLRACGPALDRAIARGALTEAGKVDIVELLRTQLR